MLALVQILLAIALFLIPATIAILRVVGGWKTALGAYVGTAVLAGLVAGPLFGAEIALGYGLIGLLLAWFFPRAGRIERLFLRVFSIYLAVALVAVAVGWTATSEGRTADEMLAETLREGFSALLVAEQEAGNLTETDVATREAEFEGVIAALVMIYPALLVIAVALVIWGNLLIVRDALAARIAPVPFGLLTGWKAPDWLIWPVIALGFSAVFTHGSGAFRWAINGLMLALVPFFFQGLAIVSFYLRRWRLARWLRAMFYGIAAAQLWILAAVPIGLFDVWIDFRGRTRERDRKEGEQGGSDAE